MTLLSFFPLVSLFLLSLFFIICFSSLCQICQRVVLLNLLDTKVNPNCLLFHTERERESPKSSREGVVGWCDGAWKIFRAEASYTNLDNSRARVYCTCSRCGWGLFGHFFLSSIFSLFILILRETARQRLK